MSFVVSVPSVSLDRGFYGSPVTPPQDSPHTSGWRESVGSGVAGKDVPGSSCCFGLWWMSTHCFAVVTPEGACTLFTPVYRGEHEAQKG